MSVGGKEEEGGKPQPCRRVTSVCSPKTQGARESDPHSTMSNANAHSDYSSRFPEAAVMMIDASASHLQT